MTPSLDMAPAPQGHNNPPWDKAEFIAELDLWTNIRRTALELAKENEQKFDFCPDESLTVVELRSLDSGTKLGALWRTQLEAMAHSLRKNPKESAKYAVFCAICVLSDNGRGYCDMSQERLGRFFKRGRQHINKCINELREDGVIHVEEDLGNTDRIYPIVPKMFAKPVQTVWLFDALAPYIAPAKPGRKRKAPPISTTRNSEIPVATVTTPISKYLSSKIEIGVVTAATQDSFESPLLEGGVKNRISAQSSLQPEAQLTGSASTSNLAPADMLTQGSNPTSNVTAARSLKEPPLPPPPCTVYGRSTSSCTGCRG